MVSETKNVERKDLGTNEKSDARTDDKNQRGMRKNVSKRAGNLG